MADLFAYLLDSEQSLRHALNLGFNRTAFILLVFVLVSLTLIYLIFQISEELINKTFHELVDSHAFVFMCMLALAFRAQKLAALLLQANLYTRLGLG